MKNLSIPTILFFLLSSCAQPNDPAIEWIRADGERIPKIHVEKITDTLTLGFSDLLEMAEAGLKRPDLSPAQTGVLSRILNEVKEEDNPWLLVGELKESKRID